MQIWQPCWTDSPSETIYDKDFLHQDIFPINSFSASIVKG